jgi:hypothetical protein
MWPGEGRYLQPDTEQEVATARPRHAGRRGLRFRFGALGFESLGEGAIFHDLAVSNRRAGFVAKICAVL